jgi:hypothetical protein
MTSTAGVSDDHGLPRSARLGAERVSAGDASAHAAGQQQGAATDNAELAPPWSFEALLRELVDEPTHLRLHKIAWPADTGDSRTGLAKRAEFPFGVEAILDGRALITGPGPA